LPTRLAAVAEVAAGALEAEGDAVCELSDLGAVRRPEKK
jgi:hypothetical protein